MANPSPLPSLAESNKKKLFFSELQAANLSAKLQSFYENNELTDVVLVTEDNFKIAAHRNVLAASSDYFRAMFRSVMKEAKAAEVLLGEINGATLKILLDFMYKSSIELRSETFASVFKAADFLQMSTLVGACCEFMVDGLNASNCLGFALIADHHNFGEFVQRACTFAAENFKEISKEEEFLTLNDEQLSKIISSDRLQIMEEDLFLCLATWFAYDKANRTKGIINLLSHVRFALLSPQFIIKNRHLLCPECYDIICRWLEWHLLPEKREDMVGVKTQSRFILSKLAFLDGGFTDQLELHVYDPSQNTWENEILPESPVIKEEYRAHVIDKKLFILGGVLEDRLLRNVECYDLEKQNWRNLPSMRMARCLPGVAVLNNDLYVVGGCDAILSNWKRCVEKFNFATRKWQDVASTNAAFQRPKLAVLNGCLYVVGDCASTMECYDPVQNKWTQKAPREGIAWKDFGFVSVGGLLYVVGGTTKNKAFSQAVECYDPTRNIWQPASPLRFECLTVGCVTMGNRLLVGVLDRRSIFGGVEEYSRDTDQWRSFGVLAPNLAPDTCIFTL